MKTVMRGESGQEVSRQDVSGQDVSGQDVSGQDVGRQAGAKQGVSPPGRREVLFLNLCRTAAVMSHQVEQSLRPHGLSQTQYNVLRILRQADPAGLPQHDIRDRLVAQVPDVPRILERMDKAGWIRRTRGEIDRRVVNATLSKAGHELVDRLDEVILQATEGLFPHLDDESVDGLNRLLETARGKRVDGGLRRAGAASGVVRDA